MAAVGGYFKSFLLNMLYFLNLQGPKGAKGDQGSMGTMGQKGEMGEMGSAGPPVGPFGVLSLCPQFLIALISANAQNGAGLADLRNDLSIPPYCGAGGCGSFELPFLISSFRMYQGGENSSSKSPGDDHELCLIQGWCMEGDKPIFLSFFLSCKMRHVSVTFLSFREQKGQKETKEKKETLDHHVCRITM